jgi:hypothetical protein
MTENSNVRPKPDPAKKPLRSPPAYDPVPKPASTQPIHPSPPEALIALALQDVANVIGPNLDGKLIRADLVFEALLECGHDPDASAWAMHNLVSAGILIVSSGLFESGPAPRELYGIGPSPQYWKWRREIVAQEGECSATTDAATASPAPVEEKKKGGRPVDHPGLKEFARPFKGQKIAADVADEWNRKNPGSNVTKENVRRAWR